MGNSSSVVPNESDGGRKEKQLKVQRRKESHKEAVPSPKAQRPRRSDAGKVPPKGTDVVAKASPLVKAPDVAPTPPKSDTGGTVPTAAADPKDHPPTAGLGPAGEFGQPEMDVGPDRRNDRHDSRSVQREKPQEKEVEQDLTSALDDCQPKENKDLECGEDGAKRSSSRERTASSEANSSGSNSSGSYTSSTYSSGSEESEDDDASDDTFFVPEDKNGSVNENHQSSDGDGVEGGEGGGGGVVVRVVVDGDREDTDQAASPGERNDPAEQEEKERPGPKAGKTKRRRPPHRHYIKDETMRTLFGLLPFYGGDDGPMDQMVKATLASVGANAIDVRNEAGDTLLILACQHGCEDLVEPILAKGANPTAVNAVGISPLHYTCFADSLSYDAAEALLWRGADPSTAETTYGCTPLHYAASSGDEEICALLLEHGAQPQTQDYYTYTAVKYAKDAGHDAIVELLGGEEEGEAWVEVEEVYTGEDGEASGPTGGLWIRHIDPQTGLAYYMNDETGESWWETDLQTVAKDFLTAAPAMDLSAANKTGTSLPATRLPPLGVREWLVQEQVRSWLVAIFSRADPLRLMEVDLVMQIGKVDFKDMLQALMLRYGITDFEFLRKASSPKLESLGVSSLLPAEVEVEKTGDDKIDKPSSVPLETNGKKDTPTVENDAESRPDPKDEDEGRRKSTETLELAPAAPIIRRHSSSAGAIGGAGDGQEEGARDNGISSSSTANSNSSANNKPALHRVVSSQHSLKRVDSPAVLRAEADRVFQEAISQQEKQLVEERKRQETILEEQQRVLQSLEDMMQKRETALAKAKKDAEEASSEVTNLQSALADDDVGQAATDSLVKEIAKLKADVAAERVRFTHITEALEATKGSAEERMAKQRAQEEDRRVRLELLRTENEEEVTKIRTEAADSLGKAEQAWESERNEMERDLTQKVEQESALLKDTVEGAAKTLSEAMAATKTASDAAKEGAAKIDEARSWMKSKAEAHASSKQIDQTNKQLHTSLRREMERAKQLHNQIEDMKGQTRMYARVRPMDAGEKEAGCKEVCLRDGKQTLALLTAAQQHWTFTQVFQNPSAEVAAKTAGQVEIHKEVAGLGTTLADGHNVLIMAVGASRSGKTLTLVGEPDEADAAAGTGGYFMPEAMGEDGAGAGAKAGAAPAPAANHGDAKKPPRKGKGKGGAGREEALGDGGGGVAAKATPLAGVFPRLLAEAFATLDHRVAQCAFVVWVSAAAVSLPEAPDAAGSRGGVVESLLPCSSSSSSSSGSGPAGSEEQQVDCADQKKSEGEPGAPPRAPPADGGLWGRAVAASSPQEVMGVIANARSRAASSSSADGAAPGMREDRHFLSRIRVELVNRSTNEASSCEMVIAELAEEKPGEAWPAALAEVVRAHAAATTANNKGDEADGFLGMIRGCLADTAKVVTLLCASPADNHAEKTERVLSFGKACENSGEDGAAQLKDLKKELARLKKEAKGSKKTAPSQLPRPAGGKRS